MSNFFFIFNNATADVFSANVAAPNMAAARDVWAAYVINEGWKVDLDAIGGCDANAEADLVLVAEVA